jgi:hypothetical protein
MQLQVIKLKYITYQTFVLCTEVLKILCQVFFYIDEDMIVDYKSILITQLYSTQTV